VVFQTCHVERYAAEQCVSPNGATRHRVKIDRTTYLLFLDGMVDFPGEILTEVDSCGANMAKRCWRFLAEMARCRFVSIRFVAFKQWDFLICVVRVALVNFW